MLKASMQNTHSFGVTALLFAGNFRQMVLVVPPRFKTQIVNAHVRSSFLYHSFQTVQLTKNIRLRSVLQYSATSEGAVQFPQFLLQVGEGRVSADASRYIKVLEYIHTACSCEDLYDYICEYLDKNHSYKECVKSRAIITTKNLPLQHINQIIGTKFLDGAITYPSADTVESDENGEDDFQYPVEMLSTLTAGSTLPDHNKLTLKLGFSVILLRNKDPLKCHVYGARYILKVTRSNLLLLSSVTTIKWERLWLYLRCRAVPLTSISLSKCLQGFSFL